MYLTWRQTGVMIVAVGAILGAFRRTCQAVPPFLRSPLVVTMSGTLQPFTEQESHDLHTLTVTIDEKQKWLFKVNRVDTLSDTDPGMMLLSEIFPPELHIKGSTNNLAVLEQSTVAGKTVTLQGFLNIADHNFYVGEVSVAAEAASAKTTSVGEASAAAIVKTTLSVQKAAIREENEDAEDIH